MREGQGREARRFAAFKSGGLSNGYGNDNRRDAGRRGRGHQAGRAHAGFKHLAGVLIAIFQAVTQIHEQTIGFILKVVIIVGVLLLAGGWMLTTLQEYAREVFDLMTQI